MSKSKLPSRSITAKVEIDGMIAAAREKRFWGQNAHLKRWRRHDEVLATIWRRLGFDRHAPSALTVEQEINNALAKTIMEEIDREVMSSVWIK